MTDPGEDLKALAIELRKAAMQIAQEGHYGWGNLCTLAADALDRRASVTPGTWSDAEVLEFTANLIHEHDDFVHPVSEYREFVQSRLRGRAARLQATKEMLTADPLPTGASTTPSED